MNKEELYDKIEDYLSGALPDEAAAAFAREIAADEALAAEVALHRNIAAAMAEEEEIEELAGHLRTIVKEGRKPSADPKQTRPKYRFYLRLAAAILILMVTGLVVSHYLGKQVNPNLDRVFAEEISPPSTIDIRPNLRSGSQGNSISSERQEELIKLWEQIDQAYQIKDYENALSYLDQVAAFELENFNSISSGLSYYRGMVQLQNGDFSAAVISFEGARMSYTEEADWHRALLLLTKLNQSEEAFTLLENLVAREGSRAAAAKKLLEQFQK